MVIRREDARSNRVGSWVKDTVGDLILESRRPTSDEASSEVGRSFTPLG